MILLRLIKPTILTAVTIVLVTILIFADKGNTGLDRAFKRKILSESMTVTTGPINTPMQLRRAYRPNVNKFTQQDTFHFPTPSVYDHTADAVPRDMVDISARGNVHLTAFVRTLASRNNRHVVYWYNPGEVDELFCKATDEAGLGWSNIQLLSDGRATIVYHVDSVGVLVDQGEGLCAFINKAHPLPGAVWITHQIGNDDTIYWVAGRWEIGWPGDTLWVFYSTDEADTWQECTTIVKPEHSGNQSESLIRITIDDSEFLVHNQFSGGKDTSLSSTDQILLFRSNDLCTTWNEVLVTYDPFYADSLKDTLIADVFYSDAGTEDTLIVENFGQIDVTYDYLGNVHMIMNGYSWHWDATAGETQFAWPQLHYSSARGELADNFVEVSDPAVSHSEWLHAAIDSGWWAGNNIGIGFPTISAAPDAPVLVAVWCQPRRVGGQIDTVGGFMANDLWISTSGDGGNTWSQPEKVTDTEGISEMFPSLAKPLTPTGNPGEYKFHLVYMEDHVPGTWVFGESDSGLAQWVYMRKTINVTVGIGDENIIASKISLSQNHPNPFNPVTTIEYYLPRASEVLLTIYNLRGQEIDRLIDGLQAAGEFQVTWNASKASSGVYFYRLQAGNFVQTRKMVLLK